MVQVQLGVPHYIKINMASLYNIGSFDNPIYLYGTFENWFLIEGGVSAQYWQVKKRLLELVPNLSHIKFWFILHTHYDHCGLLPYLYHDLPEVQIFASKKAQLNFQKEKSIQVIDNLNINLLKIKGKFDLINKLKKTLLEDIPINKLDNGDFIQCGNEINFLVIETPGHSDCSISLFEQNTGQLFVSDALGEYISPKEWFPLAFYNIKDYLDSIEKLKSNKPKSIALGHSDFITGKIAIDSFQFSIESTNRLIDKVKKQLQTQSEKIICQELHKKYAYNSASFVPEKLHYLSMKRLVTLIKDY